MQTIFLVPRSKCLLVLLAAVQLNNVSVLSSLDMKYFSFAYVSTWVRGHSLIESSHSLDENDAKFQTHPPSTLHVKMPNLPKIDVYNFRYKISVGILMKLFFLSHKCINKWGHKLVHKQIYYIASSAHITSMPFLVPTLVNYI